ncbi:hypothetical protein C1J00_06510 [Streptomyces cahuitamycinicus]|uniref:Uncharacterized protein n=1 Tax=Streptomyces cahuitamycinicus TaxID=2070367 RepID=A0A2N8TVD6_9ACTN|nr:hypothetical protein C1J00_06510 [Streptomyces cahuitamycinicus]
MTAVALPVAAPAETSQSSEAARVPSGPSRSRWSWKLTVEVRPQPGPGGRPFRRDVPEPALP